MEGLRRSLGHLQLFRGAVLGATSPVLLPQLKSYSGLTFVHLQANVTGPLRRTYCTGPRSCSRWHREEAGARQPAEGLVLEEMQ